VVSVSDSLAAASNIVRTAATSLIVNVLAIKFEIASVLSIVQFLFQFFLMPQERFDQIDAILAPLLKGTPSLGLYLRFYDLLSSITYRPLLIEWIERLVMNIWLWKLCGTSDFVRILRHWGLSLINSFSDVFRDRHYFSMLFNHFQLFFCSERSLFHECYRPADILQCRDLVVEVLVKVASVSITDSDSDLGVFFTHVRCPSSKDALLKMLWILVEISPFVTIPSYCG
jgi:hypothetical protein